MSENLIHKAKEAIEVAKDAASVLQDERKAENEKGDKNVILMMERYDQKLKDHYTDDKAQFERQAGSLKAIHDHLKRQDEISEITAHHFSDMGLQLSVMNGTLLELKPILDEWKDAQAAKRVAMKYGVIVVKSVKVAAVIIGAWAVIWGAIRGFLSLLVK
jgi:hypothetical protein